MENDPHEMSLYDGDDKNIKHIFEEQLYGTENVFKFFAKGSPIFNIKEYKVMIEI